jgi:hypothetical protein
LDRACGLKRLWQNSLRTCDLHLPRRFDGAEDSLDFFDGLLVLKFGDGVGHDACADLREAYAANSSDREEAGLLLRDRSFLPEDFGGGVREAQNH